MNYGFHVYSDARYFHILDLCLESVLTFSKFPVIVYSIGADYNHHDSRVSVKKIELPRYRFFDITKVKVMAALESPFDVSMSLDSDMLVTPDVDDLLINNSERLFDSRFPLFSRHPHNPFLTKPWILQMMHDLFMAYPSMGYVYAHFIHCSKHKWFFQEVMDVMNRINPGNDEIHDETIINCVLAKYGVTQDIGYNFMPNGLDAMFNDYINDTISIDQKKDYLIRNTPVKFYSFHGHNCKNPNIMRAWIDTMKSVKVDKMFRLDKI